MNAIEERDRLHTRKYEIIKSFEYENGQLN